MMAASRSSNTTQTTRIPTRNSTSPPTPPARSPPPSSNSNRTSSPPGGSVGQIFGSALGRALAPNNQFAQLAVGTVAGLIGQKLLQTFTASLTVDASRFVAGNFASVTGLDVAHAGIGAIASFLTAELGHEMGLDGLKGQLFNAGVSGATASVLTQVVDKMAIEHLSFDAAIGAINWGTAATQAGYNIAGAFGSFLANEFVPAESQYGAVGGQLLGAVGSALGLSAVLNATLSGIFSFIIPGLGSFFGTIVGTMLGDAIAGDPANPKATHDVEILGSDTHFQNRLVGTDDHGNAAVSQEMGDQVVTIANSYLDAVHGAAIAYSGKVMIGYNSGAAPYQYITGWFPNGTEVTPHFAQATDAIQEGVRELLVNTEVIGGDLLVKRAHQAFMNGPHPVPTEISPDFSDLIGLSGDLSVAQDYENYLNNREAINALMAVNPDTAFTAGWIATFARVNDLGLNQMRGSDFLGGLVGYLDSLNKAGLGAEAANATVSRPADNSVLVEIKIANGVEVPGSLSVFADRLNIVSDASGQTLQFTVDTGFSASGTQYRGGGVSGTGGHDILVGSAGNDAISGGDGWDFIDGGAGADTLDGGTGNDILRGGTGNDTLLGGQGDDTYAFNRGDGVDTVHDDYRPLKPDPNSVGGGLGGGLGGGIGGGTLVPTPTDGGMDSLVFGVGINLSDITATFSGNNLIVGVKDPAHPGAQLTDTITLQDWKLAYNSIEFFRFADGTTLDLRAGQAAIDARQVPFGASLSHGSVVEKSPAGTAIGTVTGFDFAGAALSYSMASDPSGAFAVGATTGAITTTVPLDYDINAAHALQIKVRVSDGVHLFDQPFTINVIDIPNHAPVLSVPASTIKANPGQSLQVSSWFSAYDADNDALTYTFQDGGTASSGHFVLNGTAVANGANFAVSATQLAGLTYVASATGVADDVSMQLSDGAAVSAVGAFHISVNHAPVLSEPASSVTMKPGQSLQVSTLFSAYDADNDALTYYVQDSSAAASSGHFVLNGTAVANGANFAVSAAQLAGLTYVAGDNGSAEDIYMQLSDGAAVSALDHVHVNVVNHAPVLSVPAATITANAQQSLQVSSWFSAYDADNDALTYTFQDGGTAGSGHFVLNGTAVANGANFAVSAAQLAGLTYVASATGVADDVSMQLSDGTAVSAVGSFHVDTYPRGHTDFNGDHHDDILLRHTDGRVVDFQMDGATISNAALVGQVSTDWSIQGIGDFNGDGRDDLLLHNTDGRVVEFQLDGATIVNAALVAQFSSDWSVQGIGDFNGDGRDDILFHNTDGRIVEFQMDGATIANAALAAQLSSDWSIQGVGDFNGDGRDDILLRHADGRIVEFQMDGGTVGNAVLVGQPSNDWSIQGIGDFNGDGRDDILFRHTDGRLVEFQLDGATVINAAVIGQPSNDWSVQRIGDFNGDHRDDILLRHTDGTTMEYQMDGLTVLGTPVIGQPSTDWHVI
jgi:hypothetical protein